jgi:hypothetical protein
MSQSEQRDASALLIATASATERAPGVGRELFLVTVLGEVEEVR